MAFLYEEQKLGKGFSGDLFGRLKVSDPYTIFDSSNVYELNSDFDDIIVGAGASVGYSTAQSTALLEVGTTSGEYVHRESRRVFSYQPGKALQVLQTFVFDEQKTNLVQRAGYGSSTDGVFLEQDGTSINIIKRTGISGVGTTVTVAQANWNEDTLDGTGPSGYTLDLTKAQIFFTEYEWLGVGSARVGFAIDGKFVVAHQFNHANVIDSVYMTSATLPVRYEIENNGAVSTASTMKQICASVQSNGGYQRSINKYIVTRPFASELTLGTTILPVISVRLAPGRENAVILPKYFSIFPTSTAGAIIEYSIYKNADITGGTAPSWTLSDSNNVQFDISATAMTGGIMIRNEYIQESDNNTNLSTQVVSIDDDYNWDFQLGRTQNGVSDIYTLAALVDGGTTTTVIGSIGFFDLT